MNTNSNTYTVLYTTILVVVVAAVLAFAASALKSRQQDNKNLEKMKTILLAANIGEDENGIPSKSADFKALYEKHITATYVVDAQGNVLDGVDAFSDVDLKAQFANIKKGADVQLPVYECTKDDGSKLSIVANYGAGLWGAIWGYVAVEGDYTTVEGAFFDHASETPGLGAKIAEPAFYTQFRGKKLAAATNSIEVVKGGAMGAESGVDAISGATITSMAVKTTMAMWMAGYKAYFEKCAAKVAAAKAEAEVAAQNAAVESENNN